MSAYLTSLQGKQIAIFGLARSGLSSARFLIKNGMKVIVWDDNEQSRAAAKEIGAHIAELNTENLKQCAFLLLSPGVPLMHPVAKAAQDVGMEIICDIELFARVHDNIRTIGVTGTNGKSTTTSLIHHILKSASLPAVLGGNIGIPVLDLEIKNKSFVVLELSSYQLDLCPSFRPEIAVLLNITPDHLDRHGSFENYAAAKARIFEGKGVGIIGVDDAPSLKILDQVKASNHRHVIALSMSDPKIAELKKHTMMKGDHNLQNALAAYYACQAAGLSDGEIFAGLKTFPGLPHRQFPVRTINNVTYINDSKATNADAAARALASFDNIYWIAGGRAKEGGLNGLEQFMPRVRESFLIGEAMGDFAQWMKKNNVKHQSNKTLDAATRAAHAAARKNPPAVVLLSPACASWDQFSSYEERGDKFTDIVNSFSESAAA